MYHVYCTYIHGCTHTHFSPQIFVGIVVACMCINAMDRQITVCIHTQGPSQPLHHVLRWRALKVSDMNINMNINIYIYIYIHIYIEVGTTVGVCYKKSWSLALAALESQ